MMAPHRAAASNSKTEKMLEIAEFIPPTPNSVWKLAKQAGVDLAVAGLPFDMLQAGERVSSLSALQRMRTATPRAASTSA